MVSVIGGVLLAVGSAMAIEVKGLAGFEDLFGRYAPGGDCTGQPQILVDAAGFGFEAGSGARPVSSNAPEWAASHGPRDYQGITRWFFPFRNRNGFPILLALNDGEKTGVLTVSAQDEGWSGGPKLSPFNAKLVQGSPYARWR